MKKTTVLVIEDNDLNMTLFREILQIGGFTVAEAADAETGIQCAREIVPTIILMDIQLPGMDGLSATRIRKKDPVLRHIPVVALTAYAMEKDKEEALKAGCAGFIAKPIDTRNFYNAVSDFIADPSNG